MVVSRSHLEVNMQNNKDTKIGTPSKSPEKSDTVVSADDLKESNIIFRNIQKERNPKEWARDRKASTPEVIDQSKDTMVDIVIGQYKALQEFIKVNGPNHPQVQEYNAFLNLFAEKYHAQHRADISHATPDQLEDLVATMMQEDRFQLFAVKIAESEIAWLQATTGISADLNMDVRAKSPKAILNQVAISGEAGVEDVTDAHLQTSQGFFRRGIDRASKTAREAAKSISKATKQEAAKQIASIGAPAFNEDPPRVHLDNVYINGNKLNELQKTMLRQLDLVGNNIIDGAEIAEPVQVAIANRLNSLNGMRANFYAHHARHISQFDILRTVPSLLGDRRFVYVDPNEAPNLVLDKFGLAPTKGKSREVAVGVGFGLEDQLRVIGSAFEEERNDYLASERRSTTGEFIDGHLTELQKKLKEPKDKAGAEAVEKEIAELNKKLIEATTREKIDQTIKDAGNHALAIQSELNKESAVVPEKPIKKTNLSHEKTYIAYENAVKAKELAETKLAELTADLAKAEASKKASEAYCVAKNDPATNPKADKVKWKLEQDNIAKQKDLLDGVVGKDGLGKQVIAARASRDAAVITFNHYDTQTEMSAGYRAQIEGFIEARNIARNIQRDESIKLTEHEIVIDKILWKDPADKSKGIYTVAEIQDLIIEANKKKDLLGKPDKLLGRQIEAYTQLKQLIEPDVYNVVINNAKRPIDNQIVYQRILLAHDHYKDIPPAYLKSIMDMFGDDITNPNADSRDRMRVAMTLVSPEIWIAELNKKGLRLSGFTDPKLVDPAFREQILREVNGEFMGTLFESLMAQARAGTLGEVNAADRAALENIAKINPDDIGKKRATLKNTIDIQVKAQEYYIPQFEAEAVLQKVADSHPNSGIDKTQVNAYASTVNTLRTSKKSIQEARTEFFTHYKRGGMSEVTAHTIVDSLYGLHDRGFKASQVMEIAARHKFDIKDSVFLTGVAMTINNAHDQEVFMGLLEAGKTPEEIYKHYEGLSLSNEPDFFKYYRDLKVLRDAISGSPTYNELNTIIGTVLASQKIDILGGHATNPNIQRELMHTFKLIDAIKNKQAFEHNLNELDRAVSRYENPEDFALKVLRYYGMSSTEAASVAYCKMLANEVHDRRVKREGERTQFKSEPTVTGQNINP